jgi:transketolase
MSSPELLRQLRRRVIEIDYKYGHRHAPTSLSALPILAEIFETMNYKHGGEMDDCILSKGHSCAALYACIEHFRGYEPDVTKIHPEREPWHGITMTAGSLGHGLPFAVGVAYGRRIRGLPGLVHVLLGDGECLEGTTWEALHLARRLDLKGRLFVHVDANLHQGADLLLDTTIDRLDSIFPVKIHLGRPGAGVKFFEDRPGETVHNITDAEFAEIMEQLK